MSQHLIGLWLIEGFFRIGNFISTIARAFQDLYCWPTRGWSLASLTTFYLDCASAPDDWSLLVGWSESWSLKNIPPCSLRWALKWPPSPEYRVRVPTFVFIFTACLPWKYFKEWREVRYCLWVSYISQFLYRPCWCRQLWTILNSSLMGQN